MTITIRPIGAGEIDAFRASLVRGFGDDPRGSAEEFREWFTALVPLERTRVAFDDGDLVGTLAAYPQQVSVPGGVTSMAGTTMVTVLPTHRRRGVLRSMMGAHLAEARDHGDVLAGLWASESTIYARFGYGVAAWRHDTHLSRFGGSFIEGALPGEVSFLDPDDVRAVLAPIYDRVRTQRPGMLERSEPWWRHHVLSDPEHVRGSGSSLRAAVHRVDGEAEGYVLYRQKQQWDDFPEGEVRVVELMASTPRSHLALWRFVCNVDLYPEVNAWNVAVDDELVWRVTEPRRVARRRFDSLWLRVLDVPGALTARSYPMDGSLTLAVHDELFEDVGGTFQLEAAEGGAECRRVATDGDMSVPDVSLAIDALGALLLGGVGAGELARAGRLHGTRQAIRRATAMFGSDLAPWCPEVF